MHKRFVLAMLAVFALGACGPDGPASIEFVEISPAQPRIGDVITVRFRLLDSRALPMAGATVTFKQQSPNEAVTISPTTAVSLKGTGYAETQLVVKGRVASVIISASSGGRTVLSPAISIAGSVPNGRQMTFQCGSIAGTASGGVHAIGAYDDSRNLIAGVKLRCYAHVADRNGDGIAGAQVSYMTEAGAIGTSSVTGSDVIGNSEVLIKTSYPLPQDVNPANFTWTVDQKDLGHTGDYLAPLWMEPFMWVQKPIVFPRGAPTLQEPRRIDPVRKTTGGQNITNNPRDNLVAMIAVTSGEEGFTDQNNNGTWDPGEPYDDLTEPFVDSDDDGACGPNEKFIDINNNGVWDGKNGQWDGNTLIWASEKILWTGVPHELDVTNSTDKVIAQTGAINLLCPNTTPTDGVVCPLALGASQAFVVSDPWYNSMAQNSDGDGCDLIVPDNSLVTGAPKRFNEGFRYTYPAGTYAMVNVVDNRDPKASPPVGKRVPAAGFSLPVRCTFTASPESGQKTIVNIGSVNGTIE